MIKVNKGDLLKNVKTGIIVHGTNAQGTMGAGFAKQVKEQYPEAYKEYRKFCKGERYQDDPLGQIVTVEISPDLWIINAITQRYYGRENKVYIDYEATKNCFKQVRAEVKRFTRINMDRSKEHIRVFNSYLPEVHFPMIGAGYGGGDWKIVEFIINKELPDIVSKNLWVLP